MGTKTLMTFEEYLHTSFDGADCEYVDGEIIERNMGEGPHGTVQFWLGHLLANMADILPIHPMTEIRIPTKPGRYRVADIAIWRTADYGGEPIPQQPPFLAIEVLSREDRMSRMLPKIQEYLSYGVEWVWLIDPKKRTALIFSRGNPDGFASEILRTENPAIAIPLSEVFSHLK